MAFLSNISLRRRTFRAHDRLERRSSHARRVATVRDRARADGTTQDRETFTCSCGFVFAAEPTTGVGCPHCGTSQAW